MDLSSEKKTPLIGTGSQELVWDLFWRNWHQKLLKIVLLCCWKHFCFHLKRTCVVVLHVRFCPLTRICCSCRLKLSRPSVSLNGYTTHLFFSWSSSAAAIRPWHRRFYTLEPANTADFVETHSLGEDAWSSGVTAKARTVRTYRPRLTLPVWSHPNTDGSLI